MFGGGMRQAGILAAAGVYALDHHLVKLKATHDQAKRLASALAELKGVFLDPGQVETNIIIFDVRPGGKTPSLIAQAMKEKGVLIHAMGKTQIRLVTHIDVSDEGIERAIRAFNQIFK